MKKLFVSILLLIIVLPASLPAAVSGGKDIVPGAKDKCAVCGMFVGKYADWAAVIEFRNGRRAWFDGVKDLMKGYTAPGQHGLPDTSTVKAVWVKDYYSLRQIEGRTAFFVSGSNVLGPMGNELIPFAKENDAREFLKDHTGKKVLRFNQITPDILRSLD